MKEEQSKISPIGLENLKDVVNHETTVPMSDKDIAASYVSGYLDNSNTIEEKIENGLYTVSEGKSVIALSTYSEIDNATVFGVTFLGRGHQRDGLACQDYHLFRDFGDGWHLYLVSDGAGSAPQSHRGAKMNCELAAHLIEILISKCRWKDIQALPYESEWNLEFYNICRTIKHLTIEKIESLDEPVKPKDFNATLLLALVTPYGMLCGHIGDGRMGYLSQSDDWHNVITPHKGTEPNQTIFMMNGWDSIRIPLLRMSGVLVPESSVIHELPKAIFILTDGCENASWNCVQRNETSGKYEDVNTPFVPYWQNLIERLSKGQELLADVYAFIDTNSEPSRIEEDDRTLLIGYYNKMEI